MDRRDPIGPCQQATLNPDQFMLSVGTPGLIFALLHAACLSIIRPAFQAGATFQMVAPGNGSVPSSPQRYRPPSPAAPDPVNHMGKDAENQTRFPRPLNRFALGLRRAWIGIPRCFSLLLAISWMWIFASTYVSGNEVAIDFPAGDPSLPIQLNAERGAHWNQGSYEVWYLEGCQVRQGGVTATGKQAIIWIDRADPFHKRFDYVISYLEGPRTTVTHGHGGHVHQITGRRGQLLSAKRWLGQFHTSAGVDIKTNQSLAREEIPAQFYERALGYRRSQSSYPVQPAQLVENSNRSAVPTEGTTLSVGNRRILVQGRSNAGWNFKVEQDASRNETLAIAKSGIRVTIEGTGVDAFDAGGVVTIETDSLVLWAPKLEELTRTGQAEQSQDMPLEIYLEGNIVFRQGDRVIYANQMYYNVAEDQGVILQAEMLTPVPEYQGLLRLKADVLTQVNKQNFTAHGAAITSSRMGVPSYWFQSEKVELQDIQRAAIDPITGQQQTNPATGEPIANHDFLAKSRNNFIYAGGFPVFYWPVMSTTLQKPSYYLDRIRIKNDRVFGTQTMVDLDMFQLLGRNDVPRNTKWILSADAFSQRGFGLGSSVQYERESFLRLPGPSTGQLDVWGMGENGLDNLGADRRTLVPEKDFRGRVWWQHRQQLPGDLQWTAEVGLISDRNFLEQYYEREWDEFKDQTTGTEIKRYIENRSWSVTADLRINDFFTQTNWLPRYDHFWLGQSLLMDRLTWYEHTHVGYAQLKAASVPTDPVDAAKFDLMAGEEASVSGIRAATRHEIDLPLQLGPVKAVPYVLGEVAFYGEDVNGDDATRSYAQVGMRASLPMWQRRPNVRSKLLNVNGVAHKVVFQADLFWADASENLERFPRYDALDDDSIEHFRRRFFFDTFGGIPGTNIARAFDERFYALRTNLQGDVTAASADIVDDMAQARLGVHQRWQTKRGLAGQERTVDWITLDLEGVIFPKPGRDNYSQELGLLNYDFRWHLGDRFTVLSDGFADCFGEGLRTISLGGILSRPERGSLYLGMQILGGPIDSKLLHGALSYRMSDKWIGIASTSFDFGPTGNIGQSLAVTRIGESALVRIGMNIDESRDNVGIHFAIEPRFMPSNRLGRLGGVRIPPAGANGLE